MDCSIVPYPPPKKKKKKERKKKKKEEKSSRRVQSNVLLTGVLSPVNH